MINKIKVTPVGCIIPLGLLALAGVSYGVLASGLGFYWDDWTIVWTIHFLGSSSFKAAFAGDRPLLAWIYQLTTPLIGESPLGWQLFAILARWLSCLALWWALHGIWPRKILQTTAAAIFFLLYPGFQQGYIAITYGNAFLVLAIYLASWGLMIWALREKRFFWALFPLSLLCAAYSVFTAEHFFGLEALRPLWIWILTGQIHSVRRSKSRRLVETLRLWALFAATDFVFLVWRISHPTPRAEITLFEGLRTNLPEALVQRLSTVLHDVYLSSVLAWGQILKLGWLADQSGAVLRQYILVCLGAAAISASILLIAQKAAKNDRADAASRVWALRAIGLGIFALLAGGIPIWPTNLRIDLSFPWDRFTLPMMFGAALLLVGMIELIRLFPYQNIILVALLTGLAAGFHYQNALSYRQDWLVQRDFFWQLAWRVPGIQPGTILLTSEMPFRYDWDNSLTAPLNWTYAPDFSGGELPYLMYNAEGRLSRDLPDLEASTVIDEDLRITAFHSTISRSILGFYRPPGSCLIIIDPQSDQSLPDKPRYFKEIAPFSDLSLIVTEAQPAAQPPLSLFSPEPEEDWCYAFEKADLARQQEDWETILMLGDRAQVEQKSFTRKNVYEIMPFIEASLSTGRLDQAAHLTIKAHQVWENMRSPLCTLWQEIEIGQGLDDERSTAKYQEIIQILNCQEPG